MKLFWTKSVLQKKLSEVHLFDNVFFGGNIARGALIATLERREQKNVAKVVCFLHVEGCRKSVGVARHDSSSDIVL